MIWAVKPELTPPMPQALKGEAQTPLSVVRDGTEALTYSSERLVFRETHLCPRDRDAEQPSQPSTDGAVEGGFRGVGT